MRLPVLALALALASPALAVDMGGSPDLGPARAAIAAQDWEGAVAILRPLAAEGNSADALNLLAFATRHLGDFDLAASYYRAALGIEPDHRGALEYQGQLFLLQGDREAAERNLARLTDLCGACEERETLAAAIEGEDRGGY
jgi:Flp pilus assembly protein TadD